MAEEMISQRARLCTLINGYEGYTSPSFRIKSYETYHKFLFDKITLIQNYLEKKYEEFVQESSYAFLFPLSEVIKLFSECKKNLEWDRRNVILFLEEFRLDSGREKNLYEIDFLLLKTIGLIVDKISNFQAVMENNLSSLNELANALRSLLIKRKEIFFQINEEIKNIHEQLSVSIRDIREKNTTVKTYDKIEQVLDQYPERIMSYRDLMYCFRDSVAQFLNVNETTPLPSLISDAILFLEKYESFYIRLIRFLESFESSSPEEDFCVNDLREKIKYIPDFQREKTILASILKKVEHKSDRLKKAGIVLGKAAEFCSYGIDLEDMMDFDAAIEFYYSALKHDSKSIEAMEGIQRCQRKKSQLSDFLKANRFFAQGELDKAASLYGKILQKVPEFEKAKKMMGYLNAIKG
ncbi:MAG: hypothetical protein JW774_01790 [Candidatus Aureabacteria bacterium]|nr:hypothetical protein [Candidatus Auribacterota bacterium]